MQNHHQQMMSRTESKQTNKTEEEKNLNYFQSSEHEQI